MGELNKIQLNRDWLKHFFELQPRDIFYIDKFDILEKINDYNKVNKTNYEIVLIANDLFIGCGKLKEVILPDSVRTIGKGAFKNCSALSSINMPKSLETIEANAFENCKALSSKDKAFVIPSNVKDIGQEAFKNIEWIHYEGKASLSKCGAYKFTTKPEELPNCSNGQEYNLEDVLNNSSVDSTGEGKIVSKEQNQSWFEKGVNNVTNFLTGKKIDTPSPRTTSSQQTNQRTVPPTSQQSQTQSSPSKPLADQKPIDTLEQLSKQLSTARAEIVQLKKEKIELETQHKLDQDALLNEANEKIDEANGKAQKYLDDYNNIKREYDGYVTESKKELNEKEQEVINLKGQITAKQETINTKEQDIRTKQSRIDDLEIKLKNSRTIAPAVSSMMENFIGKLVDVIDKKANAIAEVKAVTQTANLAKILANEEKQRLDRELVDKTKELDNLKEQAKNKEEELKQQLDEKKKELEKANEKFEAKIEEKDKDITYKQNMIDSLSSQVAEEQGKVTSLEAEKSKLQEEKTKLQTDNKKLYDNNVLLGQKNEEKKVKITSLTAQIENLKVTYAKDLANAKTEQEKQLEEQKKELESQLEQLKTTHAEEIAKKDEEFKSSLSNSSEASTKLLEEQKAKFDKEIANCKADNQTLFNANNDLQAQKEKVAKELESHQSLYADFDNLYKDYKSLPEGVKIPLQNLFGKEDNVISVVFNITKSRNIESFWQFICDRIDKNELPDQIDNLKNIFSIAFKLLQVSDPNYVLIDTKLEDGWSNIIMRKKLGSPQNGVVKEVYLKGIKYQANNRIIKQSLVLLG